MGESASQFEQTDESDIQITDQVLATDRARLNPILRERCKVLLLIAATAMMLNGLATFLAPPLSPVLVRFLTFGNSLQLLTAAFIAGRLTSSGAITTALALTTLVALTLITVVSVVAHDLDGMALLVTTIAISWAVVVPWRPSAQLGLAMAILLSLLLTQQMLGVTMAQEIGYRSYVAVPMTLVVSVYISALGRKSRLRRLVLSLDRERAQAELVSLNAGLEMRVAARTADLEHVTEELQAFAYSVAHDLRSPLRAMDGFSYSLAERFGDVIGEEGMRDLDRIRVASQRQGRLIDDLLLLSSLHRRPLRIEKIDLTAVARDILAELGRNDGQRRVESQVAEGLVVEGDREMILLALSHLFRNAWRFTASREDSRIEFGAVAHDDGTVFFVRDNGVGFDSQHADKMFHAFHRLDEPGDHRGEGIGLAIVARVLARHRGRVWAESDPGRGATFFVSVGSSSPL